jgi:HSP20 family protein
MTTSWFGPWSSGPWRTLDDLQSEVDRLRGAAAPGVRRSAGVPFPAVNVDASSSGYVLVAEVPGVSTDDLEIVTEGHQVTLRGERRIDYADDVDIHRRERRAGYFRRSFTLPEDADVEKAEAAYRNGVLTLRIPKNEAALPRTIAIQHG